MALLFDEIKIKSGLVFHHATGKLIGFTDMGNINEEISAFQANCNDDVDEQEFAPYVNFFLWSGAFSLHCGIQSASMDM